MNLIPMNSFPKMILVFVLLSVVTGFPNVLANEDEQKAVGDKSKEVGTKAENEKSSSSLASEPS